MTWSDNNQIIFRAFLAAANAAAHHVLRSKTRFPTQEAKELLTIKKKLQVLGKIYIYIFCEGLYSPDDDKAVFSDVLSKPEKRPNFIS